VEVWKAYNKHWTPPFNVYRVWFWTRVKTGTRLWDYDFWTGVRRDAGDATDGYYGDDTSILFGRDRPCIHVYHIIVNVSLA
jgi:hypothetical protein